MNIRVADAAPRYIATLTTPFRAMSQFLGIELTSHADAVVLARRGMKPETYWRVSDRLHFPPNLIAPARTLNRRLAKGRLCDIETERVLRIVRVFVQAMARFESEADALAWFAAPTRLIPGEPPIVPMILAATDTGSQLVEAHLARTMHGLAGQIIGTRAL
jgi:putative toxin-antitoxin system antitoxin component (TIGR02293 family)